MCCFIDFSFWSFLFLLLRYILATSGTFSAVGYGNLWKYEGVFIFVPLKSVLKICTILFREGGFYYHFIRVCFLNI